MSETGYKRPAREDLEWLVRWIEVFEHPEMDFGTPPRLERLEGGDAGFVDWEPSPVLEQFLAGLYERELIVPFDWPRWRYGRLLRAEPQRIARAKGHTCLKLLTLHVRAERFNSGHLHHELPRGTITAILHRLRELLTRGQARGWGRKQRADNP